MKRLLKQNGVTADDLLPAQAADTGRFQANVLYRPRHVVEHHKIANFKRLIKADRERGKHVAEDRLYGEGDGNTPTPRLATRAVMLTPALARIDSSITDQTMARRMSPVITSVTGFYGFRAPA